MSRWSTRSSRALAVLVLMGGSTGLLAGCGGDDADPGGDAGSHTPTTLMVPGDADTVQGAVDKAQTGDTVLVSPGTYNEAVHVDVDGITLQGADRNTVIFDGETLKGNGITVTSDDVVVQNLTVRNYTQNGVLVTGLDEDGGLARNSPGYTRLDPEKFPPVEGFAVRYVTASNNGLYGIYAFDSHDGVIEQSYASGHPDSGIYVGQCQACDIVVRDNVAELNAVGYEQANASDSVVVVGNRFTDNRVGLTILSDYQEAFVPGTKATVVGNVISDNNAEATPHQADGGFGIGVGLSGAVDTSIDRNLVTGNDTAGVALSSAADLAPDGTQVLGNTVTGNGTDVWYAASERAPGTGTCLEENNLRTTKPAGIVSDWACPGGGPKAAGVPLKVVRDPAGISFREVATPPDQPQLPEVDVEAGPGSVDVDLASLTVPAPDLLADRSGVR